MFLLPSNEHRSFNAFDYLLCMVVAKLKFIAIIFGKLFFVSRIKLAADT